MNVEPYPASIFSESVKNIQITIIYSPLFKKYRLMFEKGGIIYSPKETSFKAATWECLVENVNAELRTAQLQQFLGITKSRAIYSAVLTSQKNFAQCP